jgi:hypothetical protein
MRALPINSLLVELGSTKDPVYTFLSNANTQIEKTFQRKIQKGIEATKNSSISGTSPVKDLSYVMISDIPKLWKLTSSVLSGAFYKNISRNPLAEKHVNKEFFFVDDVIRAKRNIKISFAEFSQYMQII